MSALNVMLALLATAVPLLAVLKARELWRRWFPRRGKYSAVFRGYGVLYRVENKSLWWVLTGR